ncbi:MAG: class I adenylate-forming enzyme family protein [Thermomicrobiales bacterium]
MSPGATGRSVIAVAHPKFSGVVSTYPAPGLETIPGLLARNARDVPDGVAVVHGYDTISWATLAARAFAVASRLRRAGVAPGERVAFLCRDRLGIDDVVSLYGIVSAGTLVIVAADIPLPVQRILVDRTAPAILVAQPGTDPSSLPAIPLLSALDVSPAGEHHAPVPVVPTDIAAIISTSGSTAEPKLVLRSHQNIVLATRATAVELGLAPADRMLLLGSPSGGMLVSTFEPTWSGGGLVIPDGAERDRWPSGDAGLQPTWAFGAPARLANVAALLQGQPSPVRAVLSSSAAAPPDLAERIAQGFRAPRVDLYATSEVYSIAYDGKPVIPLRIADGGRDAVEIPSGQSGEIQVSGKHVFPGYFDDPGLTAAAFTADAWYRTGDLGRIREDGTVELLGRLNQIINKGGTKIAPEEIESVMLQHPAVAEAAAYAVPDERLGEQPALAVVLRPDCALTVREVRRWLLDRLAHAKIPSIVRFVDELPKTPTGKIMRRALAGEAPAVRSESR